MRAIRQIVLLPAALTAAAAVAAGLLLGWPVALALLALTALEIAAAADSSVPMAGWPGASTGGRVACSWRSVSSPA